jgi:hypothetical protein
MGPAVRRAMKVFPQAPLDRRDELARLLLRGNAFAAWASGAREHDALKRWFTYTPAMGPRRWKVPAISTVGDLESWLGAGGADLEWLADWKGLERFAAAEHVRNYRYQWLAKRTGGWRLIESPKPWLKAIQRRILHGILDRIPPHDAAHGFRAGRSILSFASPHAARALVLRLDLEDFFGNVTRARVMGIFRTAGYPEDVSRVLAALCTNQASAAVCQGVSSAVSQRRRWLTPHLPQGAPTSPALANLSTFGLDVRLTALTNSLGGHYTRYADDLVFSFDRPVAGDRFLSHAAGIVLDEGFAANFHKLRSLGQAVRQQIAGIVVNAHPNICRREFDRIKALVHNCAVHGVATQNRSASSHFREELLGRISWVSMVNPRRGEKLRAAFARIQWEP